MSDQGLVDLSPAMAHCESSLCRPKSTVNGRIVRDVRPKPEIVTGHI